VIVNSN
jgi:DNA-binding NarL/FixJ family response regulator